MKYPSTAQAGPPRQKPRPTPNALDNRVKIYILVSKESTPKEKGPPCLSRLGGASPVRLSLLGWRAGLSGSRPSSAVACRSEAEIPFAGLRRMEWRAGHSLAMTLLQVHFRALSPDMVIYPNPPSNLGIKTKISRLLNTPDHQQGIRCKAPRSDE